MKIFKGVLLLFLISSSCFGQTNLVQIEVDALGNQYYLFPDKLEKRDAQGQLLFSNSYNQYGDMDVFDITNPLQPFVYFKSSNKIIYLDNTLSVQSSVVDLYHLAEEMGSAFITQTCGARNGGIWCFDNAQKKIYRLDKWGGIIFDIPNLSSFSPLASWNILWMQESQNTLFLRDEKFIHVFDFTGAFIDSRLAHYYPTSAHGKSLFECRGDELWCCYPSDIKIKSVGPISLPFCIQNGKCYSLNQLPGGKDIEEFVNK